MDSTDRMTLYEQLVYAGCEIDHHESDLYTPVNAVSGRLILAAGRTATPFLSEVDGRLWYDVPFAHAPFWERRQSRVSAD